MGELIIIGLLSLISSIIGVRYIIHNCGPENEVSIQETSVIVDEEIPPKYEDINN